MPKEIVDRHIGLPDRIGEPGGKVTAGLALQPDETATALRGDLVTDGPFVETREVLAGVYLLEAHDLVHALACAKLTPVAEGGVEVRPLIDFQVVPDCVPPRTPSPRRCGSPATSTRPRRPCRTPACRRCSAGRATASRTGPARG
ncbi:YciI family protein [Amycolatopsis sp. FBCC-B4732]|uniref:YciI family protein n=1 Tax=Amycolatopsis sp. FBCC-B4732 TaxID=3079339 RepID=UPI001FF11D6F|nr:YciI family protein [Amycolatopsis sp. FBCC-B4732]UOX89007.1 YciI family protein [Amycolatopsis sp. FBCC-B4732]